MRAHLPEELRPVVMVAYLTGRRAAVLGLSVLGVRWWISGLYK